MTDRQKTTALLLGAAWILFLTIVGPALVSARDSIQVVAAFVIGGLLLYVTGRVLHRALTEIDEPDQKSQTNQKETQK